MIRLLVVVVVVIVCFVRCLCLSNDDCYFTVFYSNGSRSWCLDEDCSDHVDIISLEDRQCRTNYLSLKFSLYVNYSKLLNSSSSHILLSSFFSMGRPDLERLLQIQFQSPLENSDPFQLNDFRRLSGPISNIDTYEFLFSGRIVKENVTLYLDREMFLSVEQQFIDTLRLRFYCEDNQLVEWELVKSISSIPPSPCPNQITFLSPKTSSFRLMFLVSFISFFSVIVVLIIAFFLFHFSLVKSKALSHSQTNLISLIERF